MAFSHWLNSERAMWEGGERERESATEWDKERERASWYNWQKQLYNHEETWQDFGQKEWASAGRLENPTNVEASHVMSCCCHSSGLWIATKLPLDPWGSKRHRYEVPNLRGATHDCEGKVTGETCTISAFHWMSPWGDYGQKNGVGWNILNTCTHIHLYTHITVYMYI